MADADLGGELLKADGVQILSAEQQVQAVLARDMRRSRLLTWLIALLWLTVLAAVGFTLWAFDHAMLPRLEKLRRETPGASNRPGAPPVRPDASVEEKTVALLVTYLYALTYGVAHLTLAVGVLALASVATLVLVHHSRRATLRQISVSLQAISEQLRQIQQTWPPATPAG